MIFVRIFWRTTFRAGEQLSRVLRSLPGPEIGGTGAQFATGIVRSDRGVLQRGLDLLGIKVPEKM